jgi:hypothetical protein
MSEFLKGPENKVWTEAVELTDPEMENLIVPHLKVSALSYFHRKEAQYSLVLFPFA